MHIRILNDKHTQLVDIKTALAEMDHAMMDGKEDVAEMCASGSSAYILYEDGRKVVLRPATQEEIEERQSKEWGYTSSNFSLWHRFDGDLKALCNRRIRPSVATGFKMNKSTAVDLLGHDDLCTFEEAKTFDVTLCFQCLKK
jgi:hypothetical protein